MPCAIHNSAVKKDEKRADAQKPEVILSICAFSDPQLPT